MSLIKREANLPRAAEPFSGESLFNDFFDPANRLFSGMDLSVPRINIVEEEKAYVVTADVPGVSKENIELSVDDDILTIKAHTQTEKKEEKEGQVIRHERHRGQYLRRLSLGSNILAKNIDAQLKDGVLTIRVPKQQATVPSRIKIDVH